jgi:hypothetical protein
LSVRAAVAMAWIAAGAAGAQDAPPPDQADPAVRTALVTFADGNTLPLRNWTLSYDYVSWARGQSPTSGIQAGREAGDLWIGKRVVPMEDALFAIQHGELRRETLVDGRPQAILSSAAREVTVTTPDGKTMKAKVEPPHRDLLAPGADKSMIVMARSLDLRGEGITGTRREVCLLSYSSLVECGGTPADQVVKVQFQR